MALIKCRKPSSSRNGSSNGNGSRRRGVAAMLLLTACVTFVFAQNQNGLIDADSYEGLLAKAKKVSTEELFKAYGANKEKFGRDRAGQTFIVGGRISEVRKGNVSNNYVVALEIPGAADVVKVVYPEDISSVEREYISSLKVGAGFEAFVVGRAHYEFVDAACTKFKGEVRTVRFAMVMIDESGSVVRQESGGGGGGGEGRGSFINPKNGQPYKTVTIGSQTWMAENLNFATSGGSWCYENDNSNCDKYGRLYDWKTAKTVCPAGWHLPSREEWGTLAKFAGGRGTYGGDGPAGGALKSKSGWNYYSGRSGNGADAFGFSALPGGYRYYSGGSFYNAGGYGNWWTATESGSGHAYLRYMDYRNDYLDENDRNKEVGFAVRCVGD